MAVSTHVQQQLDTLYDEMRAQSLYPLWEVLSALVTPQPGGNVHAAKWRFADVRHYLMQAGNLISAREAERRVLILENPGLPGSSGITTSLYAGLQLILPGEVALCHRHSQCALRFVMEGEGAFTAVDGERAMMRPYDLILTPNWQWHDHGNPTDRPMIWLDGLDIPTVRHFDASFAERLADEAHPRTANDGDSIRRYGRNLRPFPRSTADRRPKDIPLFHYPYQEWRASLTDLAGAEAPDPHLGHALEFLNPATGSAVMPTISAHVRLIPAGFQTRTRRATDATVMVVVEGNGDALVGDVSHRIEQGDMFVVPSWHALRLQAERELVIFAYSDRTAQEKLGLFREMNE